MKRQPVTSLTDAELIDIVSKANSRTGGGTKWSDRTRAANDELRRRYDARSKWRQKP